MSAQQSLIVRAQIYVHEHAAEVVTVGERGGRGSGDGAYTKVGRSRRS